MNFFDSLYKLLQKLNLKLKKHSLLYVKKENRWTGNVIKENRWSGRSLKRIDELVRSLKSIDELGRSLKRIDVVEGH